MKIKLRGKFLAPTVCIIFVCIAALGYQSYRTASGVVQQKTKGDIQQISNILTQQLNLWIGGVVSNLNSLATRSEFIEITAESNPSKEITALANTQLTELMKQFKDYESLNILNSKGIIISSSTVSTIGMDLSKRTYITQARETGKNVISDVLISKKDGSPIIVSISPIKNSGSVSGFIFASLNCNTFSDKFIKPLKIGTNGYGFVADAQGRVLAHKNPELILNFNLNDIDWGKKIEKMKNGSIEYSYEGHDKMVAFNTEDLSGWTVAVCASIDDINNELAVIRNTSFIGAIIVLIIISITLTLLLTRLVIRPVKIIMDFLQRSSVGDTSSNKDYSDYILTMYKRNDEIGNMTKAAGGLRKYIEQKAREAEFIASGDFTAKIVIASKNDKLGQAFTNMKTRLNHTLSTITDMVTEVSNGSSQFAMASQSLSTGATQTAASLEEINSSVLQIGSQTKLNAENASEANRLSNESKLTANQGNSDVDQMVIAMVDMQKSGEEIAKIVKMIDDIAFQTNLLSLNAAVEAARAGRHGKGFAVVAEEVRNLAGRSAKAAKETAELVDQTVSKLSNGAKIAHNTQESLGKVVNDVSKVSGILGEIATASNEQAEGISQISIGLQQIDKVTQKNTANAEETSSAASTMAANAQMLNNLMDQFKLENSIPAEEETDKSSNTGKKRRLTHKKPKMIELDD